MVTTTADLSVSATEEGILILYCTEDRNAFEGYWSDYDTRVFADEVKLPVAVLSVCQAYAAINRAESFEIFCQPMNRLLEDSAIGQLEMSWVS